MLNFGSNFKNINFYFQKQNNFSQQKTLFHKKALLNGALKYDTLSFTGNRELSKNIMNEEKNEILKSDFAIHLENFIKNGNITNSKNRNNLYSSFEKLLNSLAFEDASAKDKQLKSIFAYPLEQLNDVTETEIAQIIYAYTFNIFLEQFVDETSVQETIQEYLDKDTTKMPLKVALSLYKTK